MKKSHKHNLMQKSLLFGLLLLLGSCSQSNDLGMPFSEQGGKGGSLAKFALVGNHLFTVDNQSLKIFDVSNPSSIAAKGSYGLQTGVETIFPRQDDKLFIGAQNGMHIFDVSNPTSPTRLSTFTHVVSCDPVVADMNFAFVTLRTGQQDCFRGINSLDVLDISNLTSPTLKISYPMQQPIGLGIQDDRLFVCDKGLKVFDRSNVMELMELQHFDIPAKDVIPYGEIIFVLADAGIYQYSYADGELTFLSLIEIVPAS